MVGRRWVLLRHAPARSRDFATWPDDRERPLKTNGRKEFVDAARGLAELLERQGSCATSPLARARETASILGSVWTPAGRAVGWTELEPDASLEALFLRARTAKGQGDLVLVGHEPLLSRFVGYCLSGEGLSVLKFSKGGAVALDFPGPLRPGGGRLLWALTRGQLRRVRGKRPLRAPKPRKARRRPTGRGKGARVSHR